MRHRSTFSAAGWEVVQSVGETALRVVINYRFMTRRNVQVSTSRKLRAHWIEVLIKDHKVHVERVVFLCDDDLGYLLIDRKGRPVRVLSQ